MPAFAVVPKQKRGSPAKAKEIALFDGEGVEAAFARFNDRPAPDFKNLELYIFVIRAKDALILAHGVARSPISADAPRSST